MMKDRTRVEQTCIATISLSLFFFHYGFLRAGKLESESGLIDFKIILTPEISWHQGSRATAAPTLQSPPKLCHHSPRLVCSMN